MGELVKQFSFNATLEDWAFNAGGGTGLSSSRDTTEDGPNDTNSGTGVLQSKRDGKNLKDGVPYWEWAGTWESLGIPSGATVTAVNVNYDWKCALYTTGASTSSTGPAELRNGDGSQVRGTFSAEQTFGAANDFATKSGTAVNALTDPSNTSIRLRIGANPETGASTSASVILRQDWIVVTVTYDEAAPPISGTGGVTVQAAVLVASGKLCFGGSVAHSGVAPTVAASGTVQEGGAITGVVSVTVRAPVY